MRDYFGARGRGERFCLFRKALVLGRGFDWIARVYLAVVLQTRGRLGLEAGLVLFSLPDFDKSI